MTWWARLWNRKQLDQTLDAELRYHIERQMADKVRAGATEAEARRQARLDFGGLDGVKEECRDARGTVWLESIGRDLRFALRTLRASPAFTLAAVCTLALGIGANTAIFGLLDVVRLRSIPVSNPRQLVRIQIRNNSGWGIGWDQGNLTYALWEQIRAYRRPFSDVLAWFGEDVRVGEGAQSRRAYGLLVSGDFFRALGVQPAAGHFFAGADDQFGCAAPGLVLSYGFWQSEYGGRDSAIGSRLVVEGYRYEVIGVAAEGFTGVEVGRNFDVAAPICALRSLEPKNDFFTRRDIFWLTVMGRLAPGWSAAQASDYLRSVGPGMLQATVPTDYSTAALDTYRKFRLEAVPAANGVSRLRRQYSDSLWLLLGITGLVLLIACANLANLMLARASARQREFALRLALGASRRRLIQQSLCESLLLALSGAALGGVLAHVLSSGIVAFLSTERDPLNLNLAPDWRMLVFVASVAIACCVLFGLIPAVRAVQIEPGETIKTGGRGLTTDGRRFSFQRALVVVQISVSLVLVAGALLFVRSFRNLMTLDPGFQTKGILLADFDLSGLRVARAEMKAFQRELLEEVRSVPRVEAAASTSNLVVTGGSWHLGVRVGSIEGGAAFTWVSPGNFQTLETPLLAGRDFNAGDGATAPPVAIVNQTFARKMFGNINPIGKTFRTAAEPNYPETEYEVVGVVKDTRYFDLRRDVEAMAYAPAAQSTNYGPSSLMYIRSSAPLGEIASEVQHRLGRSHAGISVHFQVFRKQIEEGLVRERFMAALSGFFGALAVVLAAIGLYGVIAYIAVRRQNEIGIRMALGATRGEVIGLVMKDAALVTALGVAIGTLSAVALASTTASLLFGLNARDPFTYAAAALVLAVVAALGSWVPAWRASRLDPMIALRCE